MAKDNGKILITVVLIFSVLFNITRFFEHEVTVSFILWLSSYKSNIGCLLAVTSHRDKDQTAAKLCHKNEGLSIPFFRGFLSHFSSHLPHFMTSLWSLLTQFYSNLVFLSLIGPKKVYNNVFAFYLVQPLRRIIIQTVTHRYKVTGSLSVCVCT